MNDKLSARRAFGDVIHGSLTTSDYDRRVPQQEL